MMDDQIDRITTKGKLFSFALILLIDIFVYLARRLGCRPRVTRIFRHRPYRIQVSI